MKIIKINDNIKINIEMIYSLEQYDNQIDIDEWKTNYNDMLTECYQDPPSLAISDNEIFRPKFEENIDDEKMKLYTEALSQYIVNTIGACPEYNATYFVILCTGLKINIDKFIYDKIDKYLNKFIDE